jgi:hypothetical protein
MSEYVVNINSRKKKVTYISESEIFYDGKKIKYELEKINSQTYTLILCNKVYEIIFKKTDNNKINLLVNGCFFETITRTTLQEKAIKLLEEAKTSTHHHLEVRAPMPGVILKLKRNLVIKWKEGIQL